MKASGRFAIAFRTFVKARSLTMALLICSGIGVVTEQGSVAQTGFGSATGTIGQSGSHQSGVNGAASNGTPSPLDPGPSPFPDNGRQKRNEERQRRLVSDTQKLLALTAQFKAEVASSGVESVTPEMLKQVDEIEKLARSVKDKMRE